MISDQRGVKVLQACDYDRLADVLKAWIDVSSDGLYIADGDGYTRKINKAYQKMSGYKASDLIGRHMQELVNEGYFSPSAIMLALEKKEAVTIVTDAFKNERLMMATATPLKDERGGIYAVVSHLRDVTEYKKLEKEHMDLQGELDKTRRLNEELLACQHLASKNIIAGDKMREVFSLACQVAPYPTPVYLYGESGVGKEIVASVIVKNSGRAKKPYIKINCGAIPEQLLESELFGYEAGAFTGASSMGKPGMFELADKGTILLDEIGDLPKGLQVKLLRVLQEQEITRVGGTKPIKIDVRIISASNKRLAELVKQGEFRQDLYFRLNVVNIEIPPLRERREEILSLAGLFVKDLCEKYDLQKELSKEVKECLLSYDWPGNIRELQNIIENLLVSTPDDVLRLEHLPDKLKRTSAGEGKQPPKPVLLKEAIERFERRTIEEALDKRKSIRSTAKMLGVHHTTLLRKIQKLNIDP